MLHQVVSLNKKKYNGGYVALISVLVVSAVGVVSILSLLFVGGSYQRSVFDMQQHLTAQAAAKACTQKALQALKNSATYQGNEQFSLETNHCDILPIEQTETLYTIKTVGHSGSMLRKNKIVVSRTEDPDTSLGVITVQSWNEVADF